MENRIALIGIIVENLESSNKINNVLHEFGKFIVGRMGMPYREKGISIISVIVDAPNDIISTMTGRLGNIGGVSVNTQYTKYGR